MLANPQDGSLSPFFIPVLIFGEVVGLKINVFLAHLIGALGMYYLARRMLRYNYLGALFSTFVFSLGGNAHRLLIRGQDYICSIYSLLAPLFFAFFLKSKDDKKNIFYAVFVLTVIASQAGIYAAPVVLLTFLFALLAVFQFKDKQFVFELIYLRNFFIICFFSFLLGAVKNFPMLGLLQANPRVMDNYNPFWGPLIPNIYKAFLAHQSNFTSSGQHWNYFYLGYVPVIFALASFLFFLRKTFRLFILLALFGLFAFSAHSKIDLFAILWQLPVFHSIEAPTRYFVPIVVFIIAVSAGRFVSEASQFFQDHGSIKYRTVPVFFALVLIFTTWDLFISNSTKEVSFPEAVPKYSQQTQFFSVKNSKAGDKVSPLIARNMFLIRSWEWTLPSQYELMLQNIGKINWQGNIHLKESARPKYYIAWNGKESFGPDNFTWQINPDYKGEIYFLNNSHNKAEFQYFSPNTIVAEVNIIEPDTLIINQNYDKSWRSNIAKPIDFNGLLSVNLEEKGVYLIKFIYVPWSVYLGLNVSLITLIFIICYLGGGVNKNQSDDNRIK